MIVTIIPAYREPIDRVLRTVKSALEVPLIDQVLVVEDGSNDPDLDILDAEGGRTRLLRLPHNRGVSAAMNVAIAQLPSDAVICRLDVGDVFYPEAKQRQLKHFLLERKPTFSDHLDVVAGCKFSPPATWRNRIYTDGVFCICTAVFTKRDCEIVDGFDEALRYGDDWDFTMRIEHGVGWSHFPEVTCEAGAFDGGHTQSSVADPVKRARRHNDTKIIRARALVLKRTSRR